MFKNGKKRSSKTRVSSFCFGPPSTFEPVLDPERSDPKKGALAARSRGKRTLIVQSLGAIDSSISNKEKTESRKGQLSSKGVAGRRLGALAGNEAKASHWSTRNLHG